MAHTWSLLMKLETLTTSWLRVFRLLQRLSDVPTAQNSVPELRSSLARTPGTPLLVLATVSNKCLKSIEVNSAILSADFCEDLDHNDADQAGSRLGAQCGSGGSVGGHKSYYTKYGSVVAFFCNNNTGTNTCYVWEFQDAVVSKGPAICGNYAGVTVKFNGKGGTYGQATGSASFCY